MSAPLISPERCRRIHSHIRPRPLRKQLVRRDGWHCHYCKIRLVEPKFWNRVRLCLPLFTRREISAARLIANGAQMATIDHITPISEGGAPRDLSNLVLACPKCNRAKSSRPYLVFLVMVGVTQ